jgi:cell division protein ZapA (FtsZ GTPase activity inhibitor)
MPNKHEKEKENNIKACSVIRDNPSAKPVAVIQAVRAINKLLPRDNPEEHKAFNKNLKALIAIRDNVAIEDTIRIMAMNTINTMLESASPVQDNRPTEADVMNKIRGVKK